MYDCQQEDFVNLAAILLIVSYAQISLTLGNMIFRSAISPYSVCHSIWDEASFYDTVCVSVGGVW